MYKRRAFAIVLFIFLFFVFGCDKTKNSSTDVNISTSETAPPLLDVKIDSLLTSQQVGDALGVSIENTVVTDEGTSVRYLSEDMLSYCEISMMDCDREIFDSTISFYEDAVDTPNLGQAAIWSNDAKQLVVYNGEYMISITVAVNVDNNDELLICARQIAALILEKL